MNINTEQHTVRVSLILFPTSNQSLEATLLPVSAFAYFDLMSLVYLSISTNYYKI